MTPSYSFSSVLIRSLIMVASITAFLLLGDYTIALIEEESYLIHRDDAYINFRAALHFYEHGVPYINPSEAIAATSSLFYVMMISPFFALTPAAVPVAMLFLLSIACAIATAWRASLLVERQHSVWIFAAILLSPPFLFYGISAWEHVPQGLFVTIAFAAIYHEKKLNAHQLALCTLMLAIAFLMRPDSAPLIVLPAILCLLRLKDIQRHAIARPIIYLTLAAACLIAYLWMMLHFYGDIMPNTYYLKATGYDHRWLGGLSYMIHISKSSYYPLMLLTSGFYWFYHRQHIGEGRALIVSSLLLHALYVITIGGDAFSYGRFFYAPFAIMMVLFFHCVTRIQLTHRQSALASFVMVIALFSSYHLSERIQIFKERQVNCLFCINDAVVSQLALIRPLRAAFNPDEGSLGVFYLGTLPYYMSDYHVVDFLGKADTVIAHQPVRGSGAIGHNKWNYEHSFGKANLIAIPMNHVFYHIYKKDMTQDDIANSLFAALMVYMETRPDYVYLPPKQLCLTTNWGLYVQRQHEKRVTRAACQQITAS